MSHCNDTQHTHRNTLPYTPTCRLCRYSHTPQTAHSQTSALQSFCVVIFSVEMTSENLFPFFPCQYPHVHQADRGSCVTVASIAYQTTSRSHRYNVTLQHTATHCNTLQHVTQTNVMLYRQLSSKLMPENVSRNFYKGAVAGVADVGKCC